MIGNKEKGMISKRTYAIPGLLLCSLFGLHISFAQSVASDISLTGSISAHIIREDELLQFTLAVKNKADRKTGGGSVQQLKLMRLPDGYNLEENGQICVLPLIPPRTDACQTSKQFLDSKSVIAGSLAPGESLTIQGYLKPTSIHKAATLTAVVTWESSGGEPKPGAKPSTVASAQPVNLGENQAQSSSWMKRVSFDEWTKILGIPVLLLLVTGLVNRLNRWREERTAETQKEVDRSRHELEQERAVRTETWNTMLPVSHGYAKFYLQLSLAAQRFADNLKTPNNDLAFFYLLMAGKKMVATRHEIGGFYFKDLRGEWLAAKCWEKQRAACLGREDTAFFKAVRASIDQLGIEDIDAYAVFLKTYAYDWSGSRHFYHRDMQEAWNEFQAWVNNQQNAVTETVQYLEGFCAVIDFECNRPYLHWYDTSARDVIIAQKTENKLREILTPGFTAEETTEYLNSLKKPSLLEKLTSEATALKNPHWWKNFRQMKRKRI